RNNVADFETRKERKTVMVYRLAHCAPQAIGCSTTTRWNKNWCKTVLFAATLVAEKGTETPVPQKKATAVKDFACPISHGRHQVTVGGCRIYRLECRVTGGGYLDPVVWEEEPFTSIKISKFQKRLLEKLLAVRRELMAIGFCAAEPRQHRRDI